MSAQGAWRQMLPAPQERVHVLGANQLGHPPATPLSTLAQLELDPNRGGELAQCRTHGFRLRLGVGAV
jgi:hypothetical protein